jgi:putative membrane protein
MGAADVVPGVSGGTMALIVGIYERLIESVREALSAPAYLVAGRVGDFKKGLAAVDWGLVIPLAVGVLTALVVASGVIPGLLETYPERSRALFFGLIVASIYIPWQALDRRSWREGVTALVAAVAAFVLVGLPALAPATDPGWIRIFLSASVAICAMILPGVSGSFLLLALGMYEVTLEALHDRDLGYVAVFALGALVGLGLFSRLLTWLLAEKSDLTMAALVGLMAGSLRALWPWQTEARELLAPTGDVPAIVGLMVLGLVIVGGLLWVAARFVKPPEIAEAAEERAEDIEARDDARHGE